MAKSTHAGLPWLRYLRRECKRNIHFWPFDGSDSLHEGVKLRFTSNILVAEPVTVAQLLFALASDISSGLCGLWWRHQTFESGRV